MTTTPRLTRRALAALATLAVPAIVATGAANAQQTTPSTLAAWNQHATEALMNAPTATVPGAGQTPPVAVIHLAMVHGAIYDALGALTAGGAAPATETLDAAVATAAHDVLTGLGIAPVPALPPIVLDRLGQRYTEALAAIPDGPDETAGVVAGSAAAAAMLASRTGDGRYVPSAFSVGDGAGEWRPTPPALVNDPFAWVARVDPFVIDSPSQFRTDGPLRLKGGAYAREYEEVRLLGALDGPRTPDQHLVATLYTANPVELFNRTFRTVAATNGLTLLEEARLFALINSAGADSLISCWDDKEHWGFWRPLTAIHNGDTDGNRFTVGDPTWVPLLANPLYPDHPSGYNCVSAGMMHTAANAFGSNWMDFTVVRPMAGAPPVTRDYERFTDVVDDTIDARVYLGIHFRTADEQGAWIGRRVARWLERVDAFPPLD